MSIQLVTLSIFGDILPKWNCTAAPQPPDPTVQGSLRRSTHDNEAQRKKPHKRKKTWIARKIRRSRPHVSSVLNERDRGVGTLRLIEELVARVEAGEVIPR